METKRSLEIELRDLYLTQKDLDEKKQFDRVQQFWNQNKECFCDYLREIARAGRGHVQIQYKINQNPPIDIFIPIEISLKLNPSDAEYIHELIKNDLNLNITTTMIPKPYQYIIW
jgi:hypothetical protein